MEKIYNVIPLPESETDKLITYELRKQHLLKEMGEIDQKISATIQNAALMSGIPCVLGLSEDFKFFVSQK